MTSTSRQPDPLDTDSRRQRWAARARGLKRETYALYLAARDPRTPWYAKLLAVLIVAYAFSPLDLIPDPIPVLGQLDDLVIIPLGIWLVLRLIPSAVMEDCRVRAGQSTGDGGPRLLGVILVALLWALTVALMALVIWRLI